MNFRSEVSSCGSRPIEAMPSFNEIGSAKSRVELKTSNIISRAKLQTLRGSPRRSSTETSTKEFIQEEAAQKEKRFFGKASRIDDLRNGE